MKLKNFKIEIIVFAVIAVFVVAATFLIKVPQQQQVSASNLTDLGPAADFVGIKGWINSEPLTIASLKGKVVLVDFWTYSCINCIRTLPYLNSWYAKYADRGFVIVGIHSPEFEFEKNYDNVKAAVDKFGIKYPIALDSDHQTWDAYNNHYWPEDYIVDQNGEVRSVHFGEGDYNGTESIIQGLLKDNNPNLSANMTNISSNVDFNQIGTPEIYLGYAFLRAPLGNSVGLAPDEVRDYTVAPVTQNNIVYLSGQWLAKSDRLVSVNSSKIFLMYKAKNLNVVAGGGATVSILLDGKNLNSSYAGNDVKVSNGIATATISKNQLYNLVAAPDYGTHLIEIDASPGFEIYTFTFG